MKALIEEETEKITIEEEIENEVQRAKVTTSTPMIPELFMQWKRKKMEERDDGLAAQKAERAENDRMWGRELFLSDSSLFVDDADETYDKYQREESDITEKKIKKEILVMANINTLTTIDDTVNDEKLEGKTKAHTRHYGVPNKCWDIINELNRMKENRAQL